MSSDAQCSECGAAISAESPGGFCARCLLGLGLCSEVGGQRSEHGGQKAEVGQYATAPLTEKSGDRIATQRAPAQTTYRPTQLQVAADAGQIKILLNERHRARDDGGVEAQQEAADRHGKRDQDDELLAMIHGTLAGGDWE